MSLVQVLGPTESGLVWLANSFRSYLAGTFVSQKLAAMGVRVPNVVSTGWKQREQWINQGTPGANRVAFIPGDESGNLGEFLPPRKVGLGPFATLATIGAVLGVLVTAAGSGYVSPIITFSQPPGGTAAEGTVQIDGSGQVTGITVTNPGSGYTPTSEPIAEITDTGGGTGAEFTVQASGVGRTIWTWDRIITASLWSFGQSTDLAMPPAPTDSTNEELQIKASDALLELFLVGLNACGVGLALDPGTGNVRRPRARRDPKVTANMGFGLEVLLTFSHLEPISDLPDDYITDVSPVLVPVLNG